MRPALSVSVMSGRLSAPRPVAGKPRTIRAQLLWFGCAGGALVLVLLGPIPPHGLTSPHVI